MTSVDDQSRIRDDDENCNVAKLLPPLRSCRSLLLETKPLQKLPPRARQAASISSSDLYGADSNDEDQAKYASAKKTYLHSFVAAV